MFEGAERFIDVKNGDLYVVLAKAPTPSTSLEVCLANISLGYIMLGFEFPENLERRISEDYPDLIRIRERSV